MLQWKEKPSSTNFITSSSVLLPGHASCMCEKSFKAKLLYFEHTQACLLPIIQPRYKRYKFSHLHTTENTLNRTCCKKRNGTELWNDKYEQHALLTIFMVDKVHYIIFIICRCKFTKLTVHSQCMYNQNCTAKQF